MKPKQTWPDDPVVREVREARAKLWKEAGETFAGLQRLVAERVEQMRKEGLIKGEKEGKRE